MFCKPGFAIVAVNKTVHRFISSVDLNLDKTRLVTSALFTKEKAFVLVTLSLHFFVVPVSSFLPHPLFLELVSL